MIATAGTQKTRWIVQPAGSRADDLARSLRISPLLAQVLLNRGLDSSDSANAFLRPKLAGLIRPELMPGMPGAVERIRQAARIAGKALASIREMIRPGVREGEIALDLEYRMRRSGI